MAHRLSLLVSLMLASAVGALGWAGVPQKRLTAEHLTAEKVTDFVRPFLRDAVGLPQLDVEDDRWIRPNGPGDVLWIMETLVPDEAAPGQHRIARRYWHLTSDGAERPPLAPEAEGHPYDEVAAVAAWGAAGFPGRRPETFCPYGGCASDGL